MNKITHTFPDVLLHCFSFPTLTFVITAALVLVSLSSNANDSVISDSSEIKLVEQDKKIAGKLHSTLHFERIKLAVPSAIKINKGVVSIDSDKLDNETVEKIKLISKQIQEVVSVVTNSSSLR